MDAESTTLVTFDNYFTNYTHFDMGGSIDQYIVALAKKIYQKYKTSNGIKVLRDKYSEMIINANVNDRFAYKYQSILCAWNYAQYYDKYIYITRELKPYKQEAENKTATQKKRVSFIKKFFKPLFEQHRAA